MLLGEQSPSSHGQLWTGRYPRSGRRLGIGGSRFHMKCLMSSVTMISHGFATRPPDRQGP
jgi:hypothetical protein